MMAVPWATRMAITADTFDSRADYEWVNRTPQVLPADMSPIIQLLGLPSYEHERNPRKVRSFRSRRSHRSDHR
jgi:hypothetical protein